MSIQRPKRTLKFLRWFCREDCIEEIEGDLTEIFEKEFEQSAPKARRRFTWRVIKYFRPEFLKSFKSGKTVNPVPMIRHNFLISFRNFKRYKSSFLLNLTGLSTGLACVLLIYLWVHDEMQIDKFHKNGNRLFQVLKNFPQSDGTVQTAEYTPALIAQTLMEDFPEVEEAVSIVKRDNGVISKSVKHLKAKHMFITNNFFDAFSFEMLDGNKDKPFSDKFEVLLSDKLAMKLFNATENLIGKTIDWEWLDAFNGTYTIAGIFKAPGSNSSLQFEILFSHDLWLDKNKQDAYWGSNNANTFIVLREGTNTVEFTEKIRDYSKEKFIQRHGKDGSQYEGALSLQGYPDRYLYSEFQNGVQTGSGKIQYVKLFSTIGICILVIACINFMNLSTAQASRRIKEVGIKKAIGAQRGALMLQYISESVLVTSISLLIALAMVYLLLPPFRVITGKEFAFFLDSDLLLAVIVITGITGIVSGSYPALYLSGFNAASVLKGLLKTSIGESLVRRGLVVFQFCVSVLLIVSVLVVHQQIEFIQTTNLGFNKDNIIRITNEGKLRKDVTTFLNEVRRMPGVEYAAGMSGDLVGMHGGGGGIDWEGKDPNIGIEFNGLYADYDLIEMLELKMAQGRPFSNQHGSDRDKVIFNETAITMMKLKDPVGKIVSMWGEKKQIVGVIKDFHYESLYENVGPLFVRCDEKNMSTLIKLKKGMEHKALEKIGAFYKVYNNDQPFEFQFLDQDFQTLYAPENRVSVLSKYFAGIAILISCLGLFGLAAFTAQRRAKEIGIRKILGLGEFGIVYLLSKDFTRMIVMSIVIAIPLGYVMSQNWLERFAYHIDLQWWVFILPAFVALMIAWTTIGIQTIKAAAVNPAETLKNE